MTRLRPYPEYKPSGIEWLDGIPSHWSSSPLRRVASVAASNVDKHVIEGEIPVSLCNYTDVYYDRRITSDMVFSKGTVSPEELARFQLHRGDVLITKDSETWDDIAVPAVVIDALPSVVCGYHLSLIRPDPVLDGRFLAYWIGSKDGAMHFKVSANGVTRFGLGANAIKSAPVPLPPLDEQRAIADFLDAMDEKITRFIAARRRMIALLEEQKQAIINQAVTRGLDPDVPLKPSGVDWLGDIPAHWEVKRIKSFAWETDSRTRTGTEMLFSLRMRKGLIPHHAVSEKSIDAEALVGYKRVRPGQLVMNRMRASVGLFAVSSHEGLVSPDYAVYNLSQKIDAKLLVHLLKTPMLRTELRRRSTGLGTGESGFLRLYSDDFGNVVIPIPAIEEQRRLAREIQDVTTRSTHAISKAEREIELMQEYRTTLVSDVVTGKLDVRRVKLPAIDEISTLAGEHSREVGV